MPEVEETAQAEPAQSHEREHKHHKHEDSYMSGINESLDKININMPGADGGGNAALLAALAGGGMGRDQNNLWPIVLLALLRGRGGLGGDDGGCDGVNPILFNQITQTLGDIKGAIPTAAAQTENVILQQTNALNSALASLGLGVQAGFANVGDKVTNSAAAVISAGHDNTAQILAAVQGVKDQATQFEMTNLQRQLAVADSALLDERHRGRSRDVEVNVTQQVNQQQQQAQQQAQLASLLSVCQGLMFQNSRQAQDIVNLGTMTASGTQAAANTQVR